MISRTQTPWRRGGVDHLRGRELTPSTSASLAGFAKKKSENSFVVLSPKKSRKESCCYYHDNEIAKNNSSVAENQIGGKTNQTIHARAVEPWLSQ